MQQFSKLKPKDEFAEWSILKKYLIQIKLCKVCNLEKEVIEFSKGRNQCKECRREYNKQ